MKELFTIHHYFVRYKWHLLGGILFVTGSNYFGILIPGKIREALDLVQQQLIAIKALPAAQQPEQEGILSQQLLLFGGVVTGYVILKGVLMYLMRQTIIVMSRLIEYDMRKEIYEHLQTLDRPFFSAYTTGDVMSRISEDVSKVRNYIGPAVLYFINLVTLFGMTIYAMVEVNLTLTLWSLLPLPFLSLSIYYVSAQINQKSTRIQEQLGSLNHSAQESYAGIRVLQSYVRENQFAAHFAAQGEEFKKRAMALARVDAYFQPLIALLIALSTLLVVIVGGYQVFDGEVTAGNIAEFILYVNMLTWPVTSIGWIASVIQEAEASQKRINALLQTKSALINTCTEEYVLHGDIRLDDVSYQYPGATDPTLKNICLHIPGGRKIAVVGKTGAGKSTLAEALIRLFDPTGGTIWLDGRALTDHNIDILRKRIAYIPQDVFLFSDTIAANIAFGKPDASREEIRTYAQHACLLDEIERLPQGFDTTVGERGVTLSGGQKQRIALARALITKPDIIILDDALSAVDVATEHKLLTWLREELSDKTVIMITHRVSNIKDYDHIVVMENGGLSDQGTHDELVSRPGFYQSVFVQQTEGEQLSKHE